MSDFVQTSTSAVSTPVDSSFVDAAACGDLEEIKRSLANETLPASTINCLDKDGRSAFHYACLNDDVPLLTVLLADARVNVNLCSPNGDTGLHMSSLYAALSAMALLFQDGRIPINAQNKYGETSLHLCAGSGDKGAAKAAKLLLEAGASLLIKDKWNRGPVNVAKDNAENPLVQTFNDWLSDHPDQKEKVDDITSKYKSEDQSYQEEQDQARKQAKNAIFGAFGKGFSLGDVKLKKTEVVEKSIFAPSSATGTVSSSTGSNSNSINSENNGPRKRPLSKLIDFPGDLDEIKKFLEDPEIDPCGNDSYGIPALHKFASWNKTVYLDLLIPKLTTEQLNAKADGKTALHWAVEMAAVGAVQQLVRAGIDKDAKDSNGRTVKEILDHNESSGVIERLKAALQG